VSYDQSLQGCRQPLSSSSSKVKRLCEDRAFAGALIRSYQGRSDFLPQRLAVQVMRAGVSEQVVAMPILGEPAKSDIFSRALMELPYVNGNASGLLIEACAGLLDHNDPERCITREVRFFI